MREKVTALKTPSQRMVIEGDYILKDFGSPSYRDRVDSVTILAILVAFTIPLFVEGFRSLPNLNLVISYFLGGLVLIFYMFYTVDYYEKIWSRWFSLPEDFGFFRIYSLVTGVIVIAAMTVKPQFWYAYLSALFLMLSWKKWSTRRKYEKAFRKQFPNNEDCEDTTQLCVFLLAQNMSRNFLILGFLASVPISMALAYLYYVQVWPINYILFGWSFTGDLLFIAASVAYALRLVTFWYKKVRVLLNYMVEEVENGNVRYYLTENRKLI